MKGTITAMAVAVALTAPAYGSGCDHEIVVPIDFQPGQDYWVHKGVGTTFSGTFMKGQSVIVEAAGGTQYLIEGLPDWIAKTSDPWQLSVEGPEGFTADSTLHANGERRGPGLCRRPMVDHRSVPCLHGAAGNSGQYDIIALLPSDPAACGR
jgi:hypothetical protein